MGRIRLAAVQKKASGSVDIGVIIVGEREVITVCVEDQYNKRPEHCSLSQVYGGVLGGVFQTIGCDVECMYEQFEKK